MGRIAGIREQSDPPRGRDGLLEQLDPFADDLDTSRNRVSGQIFSRPSKAGDDAGYTTAGFTPLVISIDRSLPFRGEPIDDMLGTTPIRLLKMTLR